MQDRLMEILIRVMATTSTTSPLHNDREFRMSLSNSDTLGDCVNGSWLQSQMSQSQRLNVLCSNFQRRNTSTNRHGLNWEAFLSQFLDQWNTPLKHSRVYVNQVDTNTRAWSNLCFNLFESAFHMTSTKVTSTCNLNVVTSIDRSSHDIRIDGSGSHTWNHERRSS